ncbi:hypothetical protein ACMGE6_04365 [Macrococcus equi]|uniref:hypothetical protein n=1 Tax=Macrococcus equi TaxID=3395462 RepID=UPI0039BDAF3B
MSSLEKINRYFENQNDQEEKVFNSLPDVNIIHYSNFDDLIAIGDEIYDSFK